MNRIRKPASRKHRRLCAFLMALLLALPLCAAAEYEAWICPACGQERNTGNFCPNCGGPRPVPDTEVNPELEQIPGETDRVKVDFDRIDSSGYITAKKDRYLYAHWNATDDDLTTCWQFSAKNAKKNPPWLAMIIEDAQTIDEIWIRNGFQSTDSRGRDQYPLYARLKEIRVVLYYNEDESDELTFVLSDENNGEWEKLDLGRHEKVYDVWIYIQSVYKGSSKPNNACLTELMLVQRAPAESARPAGEY